MEYLGQIIMWVLYVFQIPLNLFGFQLSLWQVFVFTCVVGIVLRIIEEAFFSG